MLYVNVHVNKLTRFKNAKIGIDRCPDHDAPTAVLVHFTYTIVCKAFITTSVDFNPPISMVNVKPGLARWRLFKAQRCLSMRWRWVRAWHRAGRRQWIPRSLRQFITVSRCIDRPRLPTMAFAVDWAVANVLRKWRCRTCYSWLTGAWAVCSCSSSIYTCHLTWNRRVGDIKLSSYLCLRSPAGQKPQSLVPLCKSKPLHCANEKYPKFVFDFQRVNQCASLHTKNRIDFPRCLNARDALAFCEGRLKYPIGLHLARQYWWGVKGIYCIIYVPKYGADRGCRNRIADENAFCVCNSCQFM